MFHDVSCLSIHFYHFEATIAWRYDLPYLVARTTMNNLDAHRMRLSWGISSDSRPRSGYQSATFRVKVSKEWCDKMPKWDKCHCKVYVKANYLYTMNQIDWSINPSWNWLQSHTACPQLAHSLVPLSSTPRTRQGLLQIVGQPLQTSWNAIPSHHLYVQPLISSKISKSTGSWTLDAKAQSSEDFPAGFAKAINDSSWKRISAGNSMFSMFLRGKKTRSWFADWCWQRYAIQKLFDCQSQTPCLYW